jgi:hypothetical protein
MNKVFAAYGLFGYWGLYRYKGKRLITVFSNRRENLLFIQLLNKTIALGPEQLPTFIKTLREMTGANLSDFAIMSPDN